AANRGPQNASIPAGPGIHPGNAGPHPMLKHSKRRRDRVRTALLATVLLPAMLVAATASGQTREAAVRGIDAPLDIAIDRWGIPHISAGSVNDAFFGQGYA